jgi:signal transduction histidine kinase
VELGIALSIVFAWELEEESKDSEVLLDKEKIACVVRSLLSNALKYTAKCLVKRVTVEVSLLNEVPDNRSSQQPLYSLLRISVTDTGRGIPLVSILAMNCRH